MTEQATLFADNPEYDAFVDKFKPKKTTDDCYTPPIVYDAVAEWVAAEYSLDRQKFVRPFYPGGDYQAEQCAPDAVVVGIAKGGGKIHLRRRLLTVRTSSGRTSSGRTSSGAQMGTKRTRARNRQAAVTDGGADE